MGNTIANKLLGQDDLVSHFAGLIKDKQLPHALLLSGEEGGEGLVLALAIAQMALCENPHSDGTSCGECYSCRQVEALQHPDLTLVFPVIKSSDNKETTSALYLDKFVELLLQSKRLTQEAWRKMQNAGNKQLQILVAEAERIVHATSLKSFKSKYQIILVWQPELMRQDTANKLLKLLEEPPKGVLFLMVSHEPQKLLPTILSRLQRVIVPKIPEELLRDHLVREEHLSPIEAESIGHLAQGNLAKALELIATKGEIESLTNALSFIALPMTRSPKRYLAKAQEIAKWDRPDVVALIDNIPLLLREILALRKGDSSVVFIPSSLLSECQKVANHIPLDVFPGMIDELTDARQEIVQNGNVQMIIFDLLLTFTKMYQR